MNGLWHSKHIHCFVYHIVSVRKIELVRRMVITDGNSYTSMRTRFVRHIRVQMSINEKPVLASMRNYVSSMPLILRLR